MKKILALIVASLVSSAAIADVNSYNAAGSASQSQSGSIAGSLGNNTEINSTTNNDADLEDTVPTVFAPSLTAGSNNCALSVSLGGSIAGVGLTGAVAYESGECNAREALRVMGAMLRTDNNPQAAAILKNVSCQSIIYWDALELSSIETGNADLACKNERPKETGRFVLRTPDQLPAAYPAVVSSIEMEEQRAARTAQTTRSTSPLAEERYIGGGGFKF